MSRRVLPRLFLVSTGVTRSENRATGGQPGPAAQFPNITLGLFPRKRYLSPLDPHCEGSAPRYPRPAPHSPAPARPAPTASPQTHPTPNAPATLDTTAPMTPEPPSQLGKPRRPATGSRFSCNLDPAFQPTSLRPLAFTLPLLPPIQLTVFDDECLPFARHRNPRFVDDCRRTCRVGPA